jgi:hypothetical protein
VIIEKAASPVAHGDGFKETIAVAESSVIEIDRVASDTVDQPAIHCAS